MSITMSTRRILGGCAMRSVDGKKTDWADPGWNWDYIFPVSTSVAAARLVWQASGRCPLSLPWVFTQRGSDGVQDKPTKAPSPKQNNPGAGEGEH